MNDFNNERTHFFLKIYLSHFILERVMFVVCERWAGDRDRLLYWPKFFLAHSSTSFSSWLGLLNRGSQRAQSPLSAAGSHFGILSSTNSNRLGTFPPASASLPLIYTGRDRRLGWESMYKISDTENTWNHSTVQTIEQCWIEWGLNSNICTRFPLGNK